MNEEMVKATERGTDVIKCPKCGANMTFSPKLQKLACDYCGAVLDVDANRDVKPVDYLTGGARGKDWGGETLVYRCNNCGAKEIINRTDIARTCPFCGTTNIVQTDELPGEQPTAVVPFAVDAEGARGAFKQWIKKKWFTPNALKKGVETDKIRGIYNPCFVYNSNTISSYAGRLGERYTVTVGSGKNRHTETRIRYFHVSGNYQLAFEDFMVEASPYLDQKTIDKLKPFSYDKAVLYDKDYLSGFTASAYDEDVDACWLRAKERIEAIIRQNIIRQYHADVVDYLNVSTGHYQVTYRYLLMPIWFCNYPFKKKRYAFYINGTTAKVIGKVPRSPLKISLLVFGILAVIAIIGVINYFVPFLGA